MDIRPARPHEAADVGELYWRARAAAVPAIPPSVHGHDDVLAHFADIVLPRQDVWLADDDGPIVAFMALSPGWVEHLYVEPTRTGEGIGSALLEHAKAAQPAGLDLWAFQSNSGARRFYERHGFAPVAFTDGDNEERAPDVRYRWDGA
jgi:GNAT superfamily N-acetyltransferase